jgi:hypothetical protein
MSKSIRKAAKQIRSLSDDELVIMHGAAYSFLNGEEARQVMKWLKERQRLEAAANAVAVKHRLT